MPALRSSLDGRSLYALRRGAADDSKVLAASSFERRQEKSFANEPLDGHPGDPREVLEQPALLD